MCFFLAWLLYGVYTDPVNPINKKQKRRRRKESYCTTQFGRIEKTNNIPMNTWKHASALDSPWDFFKERQNLSASQINVGSIE